MPSGKHDKLAAIQTRSRTLDAGGNAVYTWTTAASRWVELQDSTGRELFRAQQVDPTIDAIITMREIYSGLSAEDRFVVAGRTFNIKSVLHASDRDAKVGQVVHVTEEL